MLNIDGTVDESTVKRGAPVFRMGFRPFFLAAGLYAVISMLIWLASIMLSIEFVFSGASPNQWHAHEMIFGYVMAVVAGFLLTAIKNWTGIEVLRGKPLALLLFLWLVPRLMLLSDFAQYVQIIAMFDVVFMLMLIIASLRPVLKVKQYKQAGIISLLFLMMFCNVVFYLGVTGVLVEGIQWGINSALYLVITLIMVMMRRVMPMFISNGVDGDVELKNHAWVDVSSLVLLVCLWVLDVFTGFSDASIVLALLLTLLHAFRLSGWYTNKIWSKPLVWVLVVSYAFFVAGFALKALSLLSIVSPFLAIHAFTVGGIGLVTLGMMARVSLGHTGRNVFEPPAVVSWIMLLLFIGAIFRVIVPLINAGFYTYWLFASQVFWILAFSLFTFTYAPMLLAARVDGRDG